MNWDHLRWECRGDDTDDVLAVGDHEPGLAELLWDLLPAGGNFCDIGAHVGRYAVRLAEKAHWVYAIEAMPGTAQMLRRNIALNKLGNVTVFNIALWSEPCYLDFSDPMGKIDGGSNRGVPAETGVRAQRLDDFLITASLDLVKIDVEGAEGHVLKGARRILAQWHPTLLIEMHDHLYGPEIRDMVIDEVEALGYRWEVGYEYEGSWYMKATP